MGKLLAGRSAIVFACEYRVGDWSRPHVTRLWTMSATTS